MYPDRYTSMYINIPGWWFGTIEFYDFPYIGNFIIPTDFHSIIFQRGRRKTTNQIHLQDPIISNPEMPWVCEILVEILVEILWMGRARNPASPSGSLKAQRNHGMFTANQLVQDFAGFRNHPPYL